MLKSIEIFKKRFFADSNFYIPNIHGILVSTKYNYLLFCILILDNFSQFKRKITGIRHSAKISALCRPFIGLQSQKCFFALFFDRE